MGKMFFLLKRYLVADMKNKEEAVILSIITLAYVSN